MSDDMDPDEREFLMALLMLLGILFVVYVSAILLTALYSWENT